MFVCQSVWYYISQSAWRSSQHLLMRFFEAHVLVYVPVAAVGSSPSRRRAGLSASCRAPRRAHARPWAGTWSPQCGSYRTCRSLWISTMSTFLNNTKKHYTHTHIDTQTHTHIHTHLPSVWREVSCALDHLAKGVHLDDSAPPTFKIEWNYKTPKKDPLS